MPSQLALTSLSTFGASVFTLPANENSHKSQTTLSNMYTLKMTTTKAGLDQSHNQVLGNKSSSGIDVGCHLLVAVAHVKTDQNSILSAKRFGQVHVI